MKLRGAVIGVGYLGNFHAQKYRDLVRAEFNSKIEFVGVCDLNRTQAEKVAQECSVQAFSSLQDLIGKVDFVSIATVTSSHYEIAKFFLLNKVHVNVEKPMTVTVEQGAELIALAKQNNLVLCVGHSERFNPAFQQLKSLTKNVRHIDLQRHAPYKSRGADVSVVHDLMIHDLDLALNLDSSAVRIIDVEGGALVSPTLDWANCKLQFESGATAHISVSRMAPLMTRAMKVIDSNQVLEANLQTGDLSVMSPTAGAIGFNIETKNCGKGDNLLLETQSYFRAVLKESKAVITGDDGLKALQLAEQIVQKINLRARA